MQYELRVFDEPHLRSAAHILFSGEVGQRFWSEVRDLRMRTASTRRERRFHEILDEEHQRALTSPAAAPMPMSSVTQRHTQLSTRRRRYAVWLIVAGVGAVAVLRRLRRRG